MEKKKNTAPVKPEEAAREEKPGAKRDQKEARSQENSFEDYRQKILAWNEELEEDSSSKDLREFIFERAGVGKDELRITFHRNPTTGKRGGGKG